MIKGYVPLDMKARAPSMLNEVRKDVKETKAACLDEECEYLGRAVVKTKSHIDYTFDLLWMLHNYLSSKLVTLSEMFRPSNNRQFLFCCNAMQFIDGRTANSDVTPKVILRMMFACSPLEI